MKCGQLSPPTQITLTVFCFFLFFLVQRHFILHSLPFLLCKKDFSERGNLNHTVFWASVCQCRSVEDVEDVWGGGLMCVSKLSYRKRPKRLFSLLSSNLAQAQRESFYLSWHSEDSLKEPYVSSALSQQQSQDHHALLFYHAEIQTSGRQRDS